CPRAKYRLTCPEKAELFRRNKVRWQENMSVSGSGLCGACLAADRVRYIFSCPPAGGLVLFVSRQKVQ
ncbi:MAG TPA: hypothetical protein PKW80_12565, partial [Bacteroidales bacterium]|nr:hypothetical protein [Bacteroidales bacterium]